MPTKYDVFAAVIERAPCSPADLPFLVPVHAHLRSLEQDQLVRKENRQYVPTSNERAQIMFRIIQYCLKNGLDYNVFFSKNMPLVLQEVFAQSPVLRSQALSGNKTITELLRFLEQHQFILLTKQRPKRGVVMRHQLFERVKELHKLNTDTAQPTFIPVQDKLIDVHAAPLNPFDDKVFTFLAGSAQLEGSTVTVGETREMILQDIYPDKPKKDIQMVKNLNEALRYMLEHQENPITPEHIQEINKAVLFSLHRNAGKYKKTHNKIQGNPSFKTAHPTKVPLLTAQYCSFLRSIQDKETCLRQLGRIHNELQHIHPFSDGNSRTTRMIVNWMLMKHQLPLLTLKVGCYDAYMRLTKLSHKRDDEQLTLLVQQVLYHEHIV